MFLIIFYILFPRLNIILLYNSFPLSYSTKKLSDIPELPIKIFWFSQYLGKNRGLENVIKAISEFAPELFTLTLLGHTSIGLKHYFVDLWENSGLKIQNLTFLDTVEEKNLVKIASCFHIGLASEVPVIENREYCLTNKIFIYLLAGNAILYSRTKAQSLFFESNLSHGQIYECNSIESIKNCLEYYLKSPALLLSHRENSLKLGTQVFNWDLEKQKFINFIHDIIHWV